MTLRRNIAATINQEPIMSLALYAHPFSSYCQKVLIPLYENSTPFEYRFLAPDDARIMGELEGLWPLRKFPVLVDNGRSLIESSVIIEYLDQHYPGPVKMIPNDKQAALDVRFIDRFFDNYVSTPMQKIVGNAIRAEADRDPYGVAEARVLLDTSYRWLDQTLRGKQWAAGDFFSLADCSAAPALFYADWAHAIGTEFPNVRAYRKRLLQHPSVARAVDEARPYRSFFPLGAPDRD
jgi:glutathione S-transferase